MDIAEVVKRSGLPASTLRYYEEKGMITSIGRMGLRRQFDASVLEILALITLGRNAGFTLDEINGLIETGNTKLDAQQLNLKADQIDRTINKLIAMRDGLRHAAVCSAASHMECPNFRRLLTIAVKNQRRKATIKSVVS